LEVGLFLVAGLVSIGYDIGTTTPVGKLYALIVLTSVAMGLRNATVRRLAVPDLTTTVLTLTLTGLAADSSLAGGSNPRWGRRLASVISILVGAVVGASLVIRWGLPLPLLLTGACILIATATYVAHPASRIPAGETH
jgi:uncharacterized membrane protein YoaK (UPF0700 family)